VKKQPKKRNLIHRDLMQPKYAMRVVASKVKHKYRKRKHKETHDEG